MQKTVSAVLCQLSLQLSLRLLGELCIISLVHRASHLGFLCLFWSILWAYSSLKIWLFSLLLYSSAYWLLSVTHFSLCTIYTFPFFTWVSFLSFVCLLVLFLVVVIDKGLWYFWIDLTCVSSRTNSDYISCPISVPWLEDIEGNLQGKSLHLLKKEDILSLFFSLSHTLWGRLS